MSLAESPGGDYHGRICQRKPHPQATGTNLTTATVTTDDNCTKTRISSANTASLPPMSSFFKDEHHHQHQQFHTEYHNAALQLGHSKLEYRSLHQGPHTRPILFDTHQSLHPASDQFPQTESYHDTTTIHQPSPMPDHIDARSPEEHGTSPTQRRQLQRINPSRAVPTEPKMCDSLSQAQRLSCSRLDVEERILSRHGGTLTQQHDVVAREGNRPNGSKICTISQLLRSDESECPKPKHTTSQAATQNVNRPILRSSGPTYTIRVRQQPLAARACGFGEKDRRVVDPPPILQLFIEDPDATAAELTEMVRQPFSVVHCTLWNPLTDRDDTAMPGSSNERQQRRLIGTLVASPFVGLDEHDVEGCFFCFPDLSVRTTGTYSLRFNLVVLDPRKMMPGNSAPIIATAMSDAFQSYNAKDFTRMRASSELTKRLKHQGCLISVKKGNSKMNTYQGRGGNEEAGQEEDEGEEEVGIEVNDEQRELGKPKAKKSKR